MEQLNVILRSEELFAREVALGVIVTRPLKSWWYVIPGMFIFDFLRRQKAIRQYSQEYMLPRRHALYCAKALVDGIGRDQIEEQSEAHVSGWPKANCNTAEAPRRFQSQVIELLITHYRKLLAAGGKSYTDMLASAYPDRTELEQYMDRLNRLEQNRDGSIPDGAIKGDHGHQLKAIRNQVTMRRERLIDEVY